MACFLHIARPYNRCVPRRANSFQIHGFSYRDAGGKRIPLAAAGCERKESMRTSSRGHRWLMVLGACAVLTFIFSPVVSAAWAAQPQPTPTNPTQANAATVNVELIFDSSCLLYTSPSPRDGLLSRM